MPEFADLATTLALGGRKPSPNDARRKFALGMLQQGMDTSPIISPWQGAARLAQALAGGWGLSQADAGDKQIEDARNAKIAEAGKITDPGQRIKAYGAIDPELAMRYDSQLAIEQWKQNAAKEANKEAGGLIGASFGTPQGAATGMPSPLPGGTPAPGGFANNAGNIRVTQAAWPGEGPPQNGFKTFATPQDGINAMVRNYQAYIQQNPSMTVAQALQKWAPPNENDSLGYIKTITEGTGINPGMPMAELMRDPAAFAQFMEAQTRLEKGGIPQGFTPDHFSNATQPPASPQPGGLQINMPGPGAPGPMPQVPPQGSYDGQPPPATAQNVNGPSVVAPPPVPDVPRPAPNPQTVARVQALVSTGKMSLAEGMKEIESEQDRQWAVDRERRTLEYKQQLGDYQEANKQQREIETKVATELAAKRIDNLENKVRPAAVAAVNDINAIHSVRQILDSGAFTGTGAEAKTWLAKVGEQLGIPSEQAQNTQVLGAVLAKRVLAAAGGTLGTGFSNADRDFVERASGGQIAMDEAAMRRLSDIGERSARQTIKQYGEEAGRIQRMRGVSQAFDAEHFAIPNAPTYAEWSKANPLAAPQQAPAGGNAPAQGGGVSEGATATNPKTGQKIIFRNGQWAPAQ